MSEELNRLLDIQHSEDAMRQALRDFIDRKATLHVPVQETDPDIVLSSVIREVLEYRKHSVKVSELKSWASKPLTKSKFSIEFNKQYVDGYNAALDDLLTKFCKEAEQ